MNVVSRSLYYIHLYNVTGLEFYLLLKFLLFFGCTSLIKWSYTGWRNWMLVTIWRLKSLLNKPFFKLLNISSDP